MPWVAPHIGSEMQLLLDVALTTEQQKSNGALQHQETFEACAGTVTPVAVGLYLVAGFLRQPGRTNDNRFFDIQ